MFSFSEILSEKWPNRQDGTERCVTILAVSERGKIYIQVINHSGIRCVGKSLVHSIDIGNYVEENNL